MITARFRAAVTRSINAERSSLLAELITEGVVEIGAHTFGEPLVVSYRLAKVGRIGGRVKIGKFCSIGEEVTILTGGNHRTDWVSAFPFRDRWGLPGAFEDGHPRPSGDVVIGNDVWIGREALILPGIAIGDGAVVGARAVVTQQVRPYAIVVGNPAREAKRRFSDDQIERLLTIRWWEWSDEKIGRSIDVLNGDRGLELLLEIDRPAEPTT